MRGLGIIKGFDWDAGNRAKCRKHGLSLREVESLFNEERSLIILPDPHAGRERRQRAIGRTHRGRYAFVVFTVRRKADGAYIRPISARYMHRKEIETYAQEHYEETTWEKEDDPDLPH